MNADERTMRGPETRPEGLVRFWSVGLPKRLDPWMPRVADAVADISWLAPYPRWAAYLPVAALGVGLFANRIWDIQFYTESTTFLVVAIVGSFVAGAFGAMLLVGVFIRPALWFIYLVLGGEMQPTAYFSTGTAGPGYLLKTLGTFLIAYMLLWLLTVRMPVLARRLVERVSLNFLEESLGRLLVVRAVLYGGVAAVFVFLWCQAAVVLIRPIFTWWGRGLDVTAVQNVQAGWQLLAVVAAGACIGRVALAAYVSRSRSNVDRVYHIRHERRSDPDRRGAAWIRIPSWFRIVGVASLVTLLLSGVYTSWFDALLVLVSASALHAWREGVLAGLPEAWVRVVLGIPALLRFFIAPLLGYILSLQILRLSWDTGSFRPVLVGMLLTLTLFYVLFPAAPRTQATSQQ